MCWRKQQDVECSEPGCHVIIAYMEYTGDDKCQTAIERNLLAGHCGFYDEWKLHGEVVKPKGYRPCQKHSNKGSENCKERYKNIKKYVDDSRNTEQRKDHQRHLRDLERRSATPKPAEQAAPAYGTGTGESTGQGGYDLGAAGIYFDPGMSVSAMPQELDVNDFGEGPSQAYDHGYNQRGDEGHGQGGGQDSGGWYQQ